MLFSEKSLYLYFELLFKDNNILVFNRLKLKDFENLTKITDPNLTAYVLFHAVFCKVLFLLRYNFNAEKIADLVLAAHIGTRYKRCVRACSIEEQIGCSPNCTKECALDCTRQRLISNVVIRLCSIEYELTKQSMNIQIRGFWNLSL